MRLAFYQIVSNKDMKKQPKEYLVKCSSCQFEQHHSELGLDSHAPDCPETDMKCGCGKYLPQNAQCIKCNKFRVPTPFRNPLIK